MATTNQQAGVSVPQNGITVEDYSNYSIEVLNDVLSGFMGGIESLRNPALSAVQRFEVLANTYQNLYDSAYNRATFYLGTAELAGNTAQANVWRELGESFRDLAIQRGNLSNQAFVELAANRGLAGLSGIAGGVAALGDATQLVNAVIDGNIDKVGEISSGMLTGALFGEFVGGLATILKFTPMGRIASIALSAMAMGQI